MTPRYGTPPYRDGETQADLNERFGLEDKTPEAPDTPEEFYYLLDAFRGMNRERAHNGFSLQPFTHRHMMYWQAGEMMWFTPDERKVLMQLFPVWDNAIEEIKPKPEKSE